MEVVKELHETVYTDIYVTVDGEVYSWKGEKPVLCLKTIDNRTGYLRVGIGGKMVYVHRIMASTFLGLNLIDSQAQVNHLDGDTRNNALYNLQVCNHKENIKHTQRLKKMRYGCRGLHVSSKSMNE